MRPSRALLAAAALFIACNPPPATPLSPGALTLTGSGPGSVAGRFEDSGSAVVFRAAAQGGSFDVSLTSLDGSSLYHVSHSDGQVAVEVLGRFSALFDPSRGEGPAAGGEAADLDAWYDLQARPEMLAIRALPKALDDRGLTLEGAVAARRLGEVARQLTALFQVEDVPAPEETAAHETGDITLTTQALTQACIQKKCTGNTHKVSLPGGGCMCRPNDGYRPPPPPPRGPVVSEDGGGSDHPGCTKDPIPETKCVVVTLWCRDHWKCPDPRDPRGHDEAGSWSICGLCVGLDL